jgi:hypothetical protein
LVSEYYIEAINIDDLFYRLGIEIVDDEKLFIKEGRVILRDHLIKGLFSTFRNEIKKIFKQELFVKKEQYGLSLYLPWTKIIIEPLFYDEKSSWGKILRKFENKTNN